MPRPVWSGAISFGMVTVPCKLENATEKHDVSLRQVHVEDGGRVRYRKTCDIEGQVLTEDEIGKGYEVSKDHVLPITDQDLADMPLPTAKAIEIVSTPIAAEAAIRPRACPVGDNRLTLDRSGSRLSGCRPPEAPQER